MRRAGLRKTGAVVLAAGGSRRLGEAKQLVMLGGETLVGRAVRLAREAGCEPVVVVLGARADAVREACGGAETVVNEDWAAGMGGSLGVGVRALLGRVERVVVMACDQPAVTVEHLRGLMEGGEVVGSAYGGRRGIPACFGVEYFGELMSLGGDRGARELLQGAEAIVLPGGEVDLDTVEDLVAVRGRFGE